MTTVIEKTESCMSSSMTWTLLNVLISSGSAGSTMDEDVPQRRMFDAVVGSHRRKGRPRWKEQVEEFAWCDQLEAARAKVRRLERSLKAGLNLIIGLLWPHK